MSDESTKVHEPVPARPQFCLRTLLGGVTLCGGLFALMAALGPVWSGVLILSLSLVAAHVIGNSLGSRLRDAASREIARARPIVNCNTCRAQLARARRRAVAPADRNQPLGDWHCRCGQRVRRLGGRPAAGLGRGAAGDCAGPDAGNRFVGRARRFCRIPGRQFLRRFFRALAEALADSAPRKQPARRRWSSWLHFPSRRAARRVAAGTAGVRRLISGPHVPFPT